ncbi:bifunctional DNA primase/polymerase [Pseudomonas aeruginosa]|uniref:bifunctional DNA primase/polymerase n=1 Tax=Pseudomonas aeruginosa TaxID=287 RepID=UPI0021E1EAE8|nr:bifunctional DNA primase/polymerase [Pseudomonas aeruginosa]MCV0098069.1 bifunctional DNA primase/polymerase [Pseudomonas aeruginosa]
MSAKENARGQGGRKESYRREMEHAEAHESNHAPAQAGLTPSFDVEGLIRAGLTLIPLHRWNALDARGRQRGKSPLDPAWQAKDYDSREVLERARRAGLNVGVRLPPNWVVLDVDPRNFPEGRDPLAELVRDAGLDLSQAPHVRTGSGGHHYYFRKPADVQLLDSLEDYPGLEFKSQGRQVVAPGSIHPCGRPYEWDDLAPFPEEAPPMPDRLLAMARRPVRAHGEAAGFGELTPEKLAETLEQIDPTDFSAHDDWLALMMACHHATAGEGRQEFIDWSTQDPDYLDDAWIIGRRWDSLHASPSGGRRGRPVTIKFLHKVVQEAGGEVARVEPEDDFDAWEEPDDLGQGVDDAALRQPPKPEGKDAVLEEMNAQHCVVMENGKFRVFTEEFDPVLGRHFYQRSSKEDFQNLYCNSFVEQMNDRPTTRAQFWLKHPHRRQYKGVIFDPSGDHDGWLNLWRGWAEKPKPGDWSLLDQLIREVLTDGDRRAYEYVMNWIAAMFQRPSEPAEVAVAFQGAKGTGKGTLGRVLQQLAGPHGLHISSPEHITGRFNSHLQNCICLFADEAFWAGDKAGEAKLKALVTEPTVAYEGKGRDAVMGKNLIHIVMASNSDWVVPAGLDGERRFAVFKVNESRKDDHAFFRALNRQLDEGGRAAFLHDMLARDIDGWHPRNDIPQNSALAEQKLRGMEPEFAWWHSLLYDGELPGYDEDRDWKGGEVELDKSDLYDSYLSFARTRTRHPRPFPGLAKVLLSRVGVTTRQIRSGARKDRRVYVVPDLGQARARFAEIVKASSSQLWG